MRFLSLAATIVAILSVGSLQAQPSQNQQQSTSSGPRASHYGIAVVDMASIFTEHQRFKAQMEAMQQEVKNTENNLRQEQQGISQREEQLKLYKPGSVEYKDLEDEVAKMKADFNLRASRQRRQFLENESKIYHQTYLEISDAVKWYAQRHNIGVVLRYSGSPIDPNQRRAVLQEINRPVVYQAGIDITPDILGLINREARRNQPTRVGDALPGRRPASR